MHGPCGFQNFMHVSRMVYLSQHVICIGDANFFKTCMVHTCFTSPYINQSWFIHGTWKKVTSMHVSGAQFE